MHTPLYLLWFQALHEIAGGLHIDLKPMQLLVDEEGRVKLNDFNSVHVLSRNPADGKFCPAQASKRNRREPWPSPENYAGKVHRLDYHGQNVFAMCKYRGLDYVV